MAGLVVLALTLAVCAEPADSDMATRLPAAQARAAMNLLQRLGGAGKDVIAVSPASLAGAAAAIDLGASPRLRAALYRVIGFDERRGAAAPDFERLRRHVAGLRAGEHPATRLEYVTSVFFDDDVKLYPGVPLALKEAGIGQAVLDFQAPGTTDAINKEVASATGGMIPEIVDHLGEESRLVVLNALYFKSRWKVPFDPAETKPAAFRLASGAGITTPMMHLPDGRYSFRRDARFVGIDLPYADERFRLTIITTASPRAAPVRQFRGAAQWLSGEGFAPAQGELSLPKFDVSGREDLTASLDGLGLRAARLAPDALAGFSADRGTLTRVIQRVELRLDEAGTEAAGATAAVVERGGSAEYIRMNVDRPFVFALRDTQTGLIMIAGYVGRPAALVSASR